jgi:adenylate kinase
MRVAITGTPGTGKTIVAKMLVDDINKPIKASKDKYVLVILNDIAEKKRTYVGFDKLRQSKVVSMAKLRAEVKMVAAKHSNIVMEGHFSHMLPADIVVILRCKPEVLEKRLRKKYKWPTKIEENVEAEMMSVILDEALPLHKPGTVFEIDTTKRTAKQTEKIVKGIMLDKPGVRSQHYAGLLDWLKGF